MTQVCFWKCENEWCPQGKIWSQRNKWNVCILSHQFGLHCCCFFLKKQLNSFRHFFCLFVFLQCLPNVNTLLYCFQSRIGTLQKVILVPSRHLFFFLFRIGIREGDQCAVALRTHQILPSNHSADKRNDWIRSHYIRMKSRLTFFFRR